MKKSCNTALIFLFFIAAGIYIFLKIYKTDQLEESENTLTNEHKRYFGQDDLRDFYRYQCKDRKRVGGKPGCVKAVPDALYR